MTDISIKKQAMDAIRENSCFFAFSRVKSQPLWE
jgi:hypothetical protein